MLTVYNRVKNVDSELCIEKLQLCVAVAINLAAVIALGPESV